MSDDRLYVHELARKCSGKIAIKTFGYVHRQPMKRTGQML